jgi:hypothetical protein
MKNMNIIEDISNSLTMINQDDIKVRIKIV